MITVLKINKQGNKIISYTCTDGNTTLDLIKEQLLEYIDKKQVSNAKIQMYQGKTIIRVKDVSSISVKSSNKVKTDNDVFTILDYINKAKQGGASKIKLDNLIVDVNTLAIVTENNKAVNDNKSDLASIIARAQTNIDSNKQSKLEADYSKLVTTITTIQENKDKIHRLINSAKEIIKFTHKNYESRGLPLPNGCRTSVSDLETDGINHRLGLIAGGIGNRAGGYCGSLNFCTDGVIIKYLTDENGNIISIRQFDDMLKSKEYDWLLGRLYSFMKSLDEYEDKVNRYIEIIKDIK